MHRNNKHKDGYDLNRLISGAPELEPYVFINKYEKQTMDFANPKAVRILNKALLKEHYSIGFWDFPETNLCPAIPGRVDYIHHIADLLEQSHLTKDIVILDVGTGANCIYPLLGNAEYGWNFVGTDIDGKALKSASEIVVKNGLGEVVKLRRQHDQGNVFIDILAESDAFSITMCNPPFYKSETEALEATTRKLKGLGKGADKVTRNFEGQSQELWYEGGEKAFLHTYLYESSLYKNNSFWYTSLVSNKDNVKSMQKSLKKLGATVIKVIEMELGNKKSRLVAWTFLSKEEQRDWVEENRH